MNGHFVLDASIALSWCFKDEKVPLSIHILDRLEYQQALAPALLPFELANGLLLARRRGNLTDMEQEAFLERMRNLAIAIEYRPLFLICQATLRLARQYGLTAHMPLIWNSRCAKDFLWLRSTRSFGKPPSRRAFHS